MKKSLLIKLHLYAGLFTCFYLIVFGLSAFKMNHNIAIEKKIITNQWDIQIPIDNSLPYKELATEIRDKIGLMGWIPYWEFKRDSIYFNFQVQHFGRKYFLKANTNTGFIEISEAPKGILAVIDGLHFFNGNIPNAPLLLRTWKVYQYLSLTVLSISLMLGIWLWIKYSYKPWQGIMFGIFLIGTILIMILI